MNDRQGVVIPLDGSDAAAAGLGAAQAMARMFDAVLHILHVPETPLPAAELRERLHVDQLEISKFAVHGLTGDPAEAIVAFAASTDARMVVMSSHGWTFKAERLMGETATRIVQGSTGPVMVVRPGMRRLPAPDWRPAKLLVPLDGSPVAASAMDLVFELADTMGSEVDVVHIATLGASRPEEAGTLATPKYLDYPQYEWPAWAEEFMGRFVKRPPSVKLHLYHRLGAPADEMLKFVDENDDDAILLTWRGLLEGDRAKTMKSILRTAHVPIVLVRTP